MTGCKEDGKQRTTSRLRATRASGVRAKAPGPIRRQTRRAAAPTSHASKVHHPHPTLTRSSPATPPNPSATCLCSLTSTDHASSLTSPTTRNSQTASPRWSVRDHHRGTFPTGPTAHTTSNQPLTSSDFVAGPNRLPSHAVLWTEWSGQEDEDHGHPQGAVWAGG